MLIFSAQTKRNGDPGDFCAQDIMTSSVSQSHNVKNLDNYHFEGSESFKEKERKRETFLDPRCTLNEPIVVGYNELTIST